jgi:tRNA-splicing ligase RtcB
METGSFLLAGTQVAERETFASTIHGSGRTMSRGAAKHKVRGRELAADMERRGIVVRGASMAGLAEEAGLAYKDMDEVVEAVHAAGISRKVCRLVPLGNIKG